MADLSLVTNNFLATASETFTDNLSGSIGAGATTVPVNSAVEYADGDVVVLTVDPGTANEATFVGKKDVGADQFIDCVWTEGNTAVGHDAGATIIDYDSATHYNLLTKAVKGIMNQDGTLKDQPIRDALGLSNASQDGWEVFPYTINTSSGYNKGQGIYELIVPNQDVSSLLSPGMKLRVERSVAPPTQCAKFVAASSQYASRASGSVTGFTFTDDFTVECWVKLDSYDSVRSNIVSRRSGTTGASGFTMGVESTGQVVLTAATTTNSRNLLSRQSVPLKKWTHIATTLDMSGSGGVVYLNGISVQISYTSSGTPPNSFTQSGPLQIGAVNGANQFVNGKVCEARIWSIVRSATEISDNMNNTLTGMESNLVGYWKLNGNFDDSTSNANHLVASGGAVATDVDNPLKSTEYGIVLKVDYSSPNSVITVFTGEDHNIPNMALQSPYYSTQGNPSGFPSAKDKWKIEAQYAYDASQAAPTAQAWYNLVSAQLLVPVGAWGIDYSVHAYADKAAAAQIGIRTSLSTSSSAVSDQNMTAVIDINPVISASGTVGRSGGVVNSAPTPQYLIIAAWQGSTQNIYALGGRSITSIRAKCDYI